MRLDDRRTQPSRNRRGSGSGCWRGPEISVGNTAEVVMGRRCRGRPRWHAVHRCRCARAGRSRSSDRSRSGSNGGDVLGGEARCRRGNFTPRAQGELRAVSVVRLLGHAGGQRRMGHGRRCRGCTAPRSPARAALEEAKEETPGRSESGKDGGAAHQSPSPFAAAGRGRASRLPASAARPRSRRPRPFDAMAWGPFMQGGSCKAGHARRVMRCSARRWQAACVARSRGSVKLRVAARGRVPRHAGSGGGIGSPCGRCVGAADARRARAAAARAPGAVRRHGREQRTRVGMARGGRYSAAFGRELHDPAEIHHRDAAGDVADDAQVVRDEQIRQGELGPASSVSRFTTWAWIETSSAETGSSQTMNSGRSASARAMPMRWRCPPLNWCGVAARHASARKADQRQQLGDAVALCSRTGTPARCMRLGDDGGHGHARIERGARVLEDQLAAPAGERAGRPGSAMSCPSKQHACRGRARRGGPAGGRWWSCRSRSRRPGRGSRPGRCSKLTPSTARTVRRPAGKWRTRFSATTSGISRRIADAGRLVPAPGRGAHRRHAGGCMARWRQGGSADGRRSRRAAPTGSPPGPGWRAGSAGSSSSSAGMLCSRPGGVGVQRGPPNRSRRPARARPMRPAYITSTVVGDARRPRRGRG